MRHSFLIFFCVLLFVKHGNTQIIFQEEFLNTSIAHLAEIAEDKKHEFDVVGVIKTDGLSFRPLEKALERLDFNSSRWFVRFTVKNTSVT